jgi:hypothetical protein
MKQILCVVTLAACGSTWAHAQTIADVARQERARRQALAKVAITNETLKVDSTLYRETVKEEPEAKESAAEAAAPKAEPAKDEKWWRTEFEKVRADISRAEGQLVVLDADLKKANFEYLTRSYDPDGSGKKAIDTINGKINSAKQDLAASQQKLAQLEEDLRRAGGPAGWAR